MMTPKLQTGSRVRHSQRFIDFALSYRPNKFGDGTAGMLVAEETLKDWFESDGFLNRVREFYNCEGIVLGHPHDGWPEWEVRWQPSGLRYSYKAEWLEPVDTGPRVQLDSHDVRALRRRKEWLNKRRFEHSQEQRGAASFEIAELIAITKILEAFDKETHDHAGQNECADRR